MGDPEKGDKKSSEKEDTKSQESSPDEPKAAESKASSESSGEAPPKEQGGPLPDVESQESSPTSEAAAPPSSGLMGKLKGILKKTDSSPGGSNVVSLKEIRNKKATATDPGKKSIKEKLLFPFIVALKFPSTVFNLFRYGDPPSKVLALGILFAVALFAGSTLKIFQLIDDKLNNLSPDQQASIQKVKDSFRKQDMNIQEFVEKQYGTEEDRKRLKLGPLTLLTRSKNNPKLRSVEMTIHVLCDSPESCSFIKQNIASTQDLLIMNLEPVDFEDMTTKDGRVKVKEKIKEAIDKLGRSGAVEDVFFSTLLGN